MRDIDCPFCQGVGKVKIERAYTPYNEKTAQKIVELRRVGKTYRDIAKEVGLDHPQKVKHMLDKWFKNQITQ